MARKSPDRRILRTRKLLQEALFALILEKGYEAIIVQNIIDHANIGRSTFYAHFLDKQALFLYGFEEVYFADSPEVMKCGSATERET